MRAYLLICITLILLSCSPKSPLILASDYYRVVLELEDSEELPFVIHVASKDTIKVFNAEEEILVHEIDYRNDSIFIQMPFFEGLIAAKINKIGFKGLFIQESLERAIPIKAERGIKERFTLKRKSKPIDVSGTWEGNF